VIPKGFRYVSAQGFDSTGVKLSEKSGRSGKPRYIYDLREEVSVEQANVKGKTQVQTANLEHPAELVRRSKSGAEVEKG
jgi:hypothetical protein